MASFVTNDELQDYMQLGSIDANAAAVVIEGASDLVVDYCGWALQEATETFTLNGQGSAMLPLPTLALSAVDELRVDGVIVDADSYEWSTNGAIRRTDGDVFARAYRNVELDCTHGYQALPGSIRLVVLDIAARAYANPNALRSETIGDITRSYSDNAGAAFSKLHEAMLSGYRLP